MTARHRRGTSCRADHGDSAAGHLVCGAFRAATSRELGLSADCCAFPVRLHRFGTVSSGHRFRALRSQRPEQRFLAVKKMMTASAAHNRTLGCDFGSALGSGPFWNDPWNYFVASQTLRLENLKIEAGGELRV